MLKEAITMIGKELDRFQITQESIQIKSFPKTDTIPLSGYRMMIVTIPTYKLQKGSAHLSFKRLALLEKMNDIVEKHYSEMLPSQPKATGVIRIST